MELKKVLNFCAWPRTGRLCSMRNLNSVSQPWCFKMTHKLTFVPFIIFKTYQQQKKTFLSCLWS